MHSPLPSILLLSVLALSAAALKWSSDDDDSNRDKPTGPHPDVILGITLAGVGLAAIIAPAIIVGPALAAVGFGPLGPVAGRFPRSSSYPRSILSTTTLGQTNNSDGQRAGSLAALVQQCINWIMR